MKKTSIIKQDARTPSFKAGEMVYVSPFERNLTIEDVWWTGVSNMYAFKEIETALTEVFLFPKRVPHCELCAKLDLPECQDIPECGNIHVQFMVAVSGYVPKGTDVKSLGLDVPKDIHIIDHVDGRGTKRVEGAKTLNFSVLSVTD